MKFFFVEIYRDIREERDDDNGLHHILSHAIYAMVRVFVQK